MIIMKIIPSLQIGRATVILVKVTKQSSRLSSRSFFFFLSPTEISIVLSKLLRNSLDRSLPRIVLRRAQYHFINFLSSFPRERRRRTSCLLSVMSRSILAFNVHVIKLISSDTGRRNPRKPNPLMCVCVACTRYTYDTHLITKTLHRSFHISRLLRRLFTRSLSDNRWYQRDAIAVFVVAREREKEEG